MRYHMISRLIVVSLLPSLIGCCLIPVQKMGDTEGTAPALEGTWALQELDNTILSVEIDSSGDPGEIILPSGVIPTDLPFELPDELILDGKQHSIGVPLVPFAVIYVGNGTAIKDGDASFVAVGDNIQVTARLKIYVMLPLLLTPAQKLVEVTVDYIGAFTEGTKAEGDADVGVTLSDNINLILNLVGGGASLEDTTMTLSNVDFVKQ